MRGKESWVVTAAGRDSPFAAVLGSATGLLAQPSTVVSGKPGAKCCVYRLQQGDARAFAKVYPESALGARVGRSRGRREWHNLQALAQWGVAVPPLLAYGVHQAAGRREAVLVTAGVPGAVDMASLLRNNPDYFADAAWFRALCQALGTQVRRMHAAGFAHNDLNWRNVLVAPDPSPQAWLFDCPNGRRWWPPLLGFHVAKDLTHLDKMGRRWLSARQRLQFFHAYTGQRPLQAADRALLQRVLRRAVDPKYLPPAAAPASRPQA